MGNTAKLRLFKLHLIENIHCKVCVSKVMSADKLHRNKNHKLGFQE